MAGLENDFRAAQEFARDGEDAGAAMTRRNMQSNMLKNSDVVIDLGSAGDPNTRYVAMHAESLGEGFTFMEVDADLVDRGHCNNDIHSLSDLSFGQNNQFAPQFEGFIDSVQLSDLPQAVKNNIQAELNSANPEVDVIVENVAREASGVCALPGMGSKP